MIAEVEAGMTEATVREAHAWQLLDGPFIMDVL